MSEAVILKNGIPCFDSTGSVAMVPRSEFQSSLGFEHRQVAFTEALGGGVVMILIADLGAEQHPAAGMYPTGFMGLARKYNIGGIHNGFGMALINAVASYEISSAGVCLKTTHDRIVPFVGRYNGRYYLGIKVSGNSGTLYLDGICSNMLVNPIILGSKNGTSSEGMEVLFEGTVSAQSGG